MLILLSRINGLTLFTSYASGIRSKTFIEKNRRILNQVKYFTASSSKDSKEMASNLKRIAVCQMTSIGDKAVNLSVIEDLVRKAVDDKAKSGDHRFTFSESKFLGSMPIYFNSFKSFGKCCRGRHYISKMYNEYLKQMIFFPEACDYLCDNKKDMLSLAEPIIGGSLVNSYRNLARKHKVWLSMGGLHEKIADKPDKVYNTHIIIDDQGKVVQAYRKLHLFDVEIPEKNLRLKESDFALAGEHIITPVETPVGKIGLAICYDMRFSEFSTQLAILGSDILTYPSAFTYTTGKAHWETILRCRAIENQCFVIAAAQIGQHNPKRRSWGHAVAIDPWGGVLATCGDNADQPTFAIADLDYNKLQDVRANMPVFEHRRNSAYSLYPLSLRSSLLAIHREPENECRTATLGKSDTTLPPCESDLSPDEPTYPFGPNAKVRESCTFYKSPLSYAFVNLRCEICLCYELVAVVCHNLNWGNKEYTDPGVRCVVPGHVLVAPLRNAVRMEDLSKEEVNDFFRTVVEVVKVMEKVHGVSSTTVTVQDGPEAGRTIEHVHCHIMPRRIGDFKDNDLIYLELAKHDRRLDDHPIKPARTLQEMREEAAILRQAFTS